MQKYIYTRFPSETVTRSGYQVSCCGFMSMLVPSALCMLSLCALYALQLVLGTLLPE